MIGETVLTGFVIGAAAGGVGGWVSARSADWLRAHRNRRDVDRMLKRAERVRRARERRA